uniref:RNase H domain-containing protein n=1 Tax=Trichuris muris TaxID=70415 RepID=A0A5S6QEW3_TRIMR
MWMEVDGVPRRVLIDTGCTRCIAHASCCRKWRKQRIDVTTVSGEQLRCVCVGSVKLQAPEGRRVTVEVIISEKKPLDFDFIIGMSGIAALGGVAVDGQGQARFGLSATTICASADASIHIDEKDFIATYDPASCSWTTAWKWANGKAPEIVWNSREEYPPAAEVRTSYAKELDLWIRNGWLIPYDEKRLVPAKALIPLMAVTQHNKDKVRPVMDFRELNSYIDVFTAKSEMCAHKLREWRRQGENISIVDLRKAYLQLHVDETLWPFQTVMIRGRRYCLTRLGFGLNVAPMIMQAVVNRVLSLAPDIQEGTSAYVDDIFVNENVVSASRVMQHFAKYGLSCKAPVQATRGARILSLTVRWENGALVWSRGNEIKELPKPLTREELYSLTAAGLWAITQWDDEIHDKRILERLRELAAMVTAHDPVRGKWAVSGNKAKVWVDASTLAIGIAVEVNGAIIEDTSWLRPDDCHHINLAELDAVITGLNVALSWQLQDIELMTDSTTVYRWLDEGLSGRSRLKN